MHLKIKTKIWLTLFVIILMFSFFILFYFPNKQEKYLKSNYETEVQNFANTVSFWVQIALTKQDFDGVQTAMNYVIGDKRLKYICLLEIDSAKNLGKDSYVYYKRISLTYPDTLETSGVYSLLRDYDNAESEEKKLALTSTNLSIIKFSPFSTPRTRGEIMLCFSTNEIVRSKQEIRQTSLVLISIVLVISVLIGFWLAQIISVPVNALRDAALKVGIGDYTQQVKKTSGDEIGELGKAFNKMVRDLSTTQAQLTQSEKLASLGALTAGVAHEINNPINFVSANITPLKRDINDIMLLLEKYSSLDQNNYQTKLGEILKYKEQIDLSYTINEIKSLTKGIEEGSKRTAEIVKGLRNFSRPDDEEMRKANINDGIESTLVLLQNKLSHKKIEVIKSLGNIPEIACYPGQLNQVFMNLFTNAIDAIDENAETRERKLSITTSKQNTQIIISIHDTGNGIPDEIKRKIFDPFFTTKDVGKGTGLGLSISYGIIEKHNGKFEVKSEVGKGTEFVITLSV